MINERSNSRVTIIMITFVLIVPMITNTAMTANYAAAQNNSSSNTPSASITNATSVSAPSPKDITDTKGLVAEMMRIEGSIDPVDIATLAYIWGYPLVLTNRHVDYSTSPNIPPGPGRGPLNTLLHVRDLVNANITDLVHPNVDTLYSVAFIRLNEGPLVLKVPPIADRYYTFQFMDAYSNNFMYVGSRTNVTSGGTFLITRPNWNGTAPSGMTMIESPTITMWLNIRVLVDDQQDVRGVRMLQDQMNLYPMEAQNNNKATMLGDQSSSVPVSFQPTAVPTTGIKIFDEICKDMSLDLPYSYDANILAKFKTIGIGPDLTPSGTTNQMILKALEQGIVRGEKLIDEKVEHSSTLVNGWSFNLDSGNFGTDYLLRAAIAKSSLAENSAEEAVYPKVYVDGNGSALSGNHKYVLHFEKEKIPPVKAFWSLTMYNSKAFLVDNPIDRYAIGDRNPGLKYNTDGSLDIYLQHDSPGKVKESNWLPAPEDDFHLMLRMYVPEEIVLKGGYQIPAVQRVT